MLPSRVASVDAEAGFWSLLYPQRCCVPSFSSCGPPHGPAGMAGQLVLQAGRAPRRPGPWPSSHPPA